MPPASHALRRRALPVLLLLLVAGPPPAAAGPWRLDQALDLPSRLSLSVEHRFRYEYLDDQFQVGFNGRDGALLLRTLLRARLRLTDWLAVGGEFEDARAELLARSSPISTTIVNAAELLEAYAELSAPWPFGGESTARLGRVTIDVGSRRLVARNRFRNTINAFTGLDWSWQGSGGKSLRAFLVLPVDRRPRLAEDLRKNRVKFDRESFDVGFWGLYFGAGLPWGDPGEVYLFGLHEKDSADRPTSNRQLYTPGLRIFRLPSEGRFDYEIESGLQFGSSRATTASTRDLDHFAHFHHAEIGYSFAAPGSPRLVLQYDYASGDQDPEDGDNQRFDRLFGARRFEFGPTGTYGAVARSNINTPGIRLEWKPCARLSSFAAFRGFWLASDRDAWTTAGVQDPEGRSGSFVGSQIEFSVGWELLPGNLRLEAGYAHLFAGRFLDEAPNSNRQGDVNYAYSQLVLSF